ncbi:alpha/beta fold hydrolase [Nocardia carnea]|uniref:alpha/beta fold hydrolase n=1 Tax=Nocardia carnea TaxID=37328 RepID=UPI002455B8C2|nr:alpha/beta fold hydrolase [Nocardia carnea]
METRDVFVPTRLGQLHVVVTGQGDPILLWPSLLMDASLWDSQIDYFARSHTVIGVDPPGHGRSSPLERQFTFGECAQCVVDILDHFEIPWTYFIGNSWGAMVGATFSAGFPERVRAAVLMNGTASPASRRQRLEYRALLVLVRMLGGIRPPLTWSVVRAFLGPTSQRSRPDVVRRVLTIAQKNDPDSLIRAVRSVVIARPDQRPALASITCPTLVIAGREDRTFPLPEVEAMAESIPGATLAVIDDAAHLVAAEVPDRVNDAIRTFLARDTHTGK